MDNRKRYDGNLIFVMCAILFSSLIINLFLRRNADFGYLNLSVYDTAKTAQTNLSVLLYVFIKRAEQFVIAFALMKLLRPDVVYRFILVLLGMMFGTMSTIQTYYDGFSGVILLLLYLLPHYVVYLLLLNRTSVFLTYGKGDGKKLRFFAFALALLLLGTILEGILSRFFLYKFYQYMVRL